MGARSGPEKVGKWGVPPKLLAIYFPVGAGAGREDREARHLPPLPGEPRAGGSPGWRGTKRGAGGDTLLRPHSNLGGPRR